MNNLFVKLGILLGFLSSAFSDWKREVWSRDLDERYCCDGRECCCQAMTVRDVYAPEGGEA